MNVMTGPGKGNGFGWSSGSRQLGLLVWEWLGRLGVGLD